MRRMFETRAEVSGIPDLGQEAYLSQRIGGHVYRQGMLNEPASPSDFKDRDVQEDPGEGL